MAYSPKAQALRRCRAVRKDGQPCRAYAVWDDSRGLCAAHGRHHTGKMPRRPGPTMRTKNPPCTCQAYAWPHRPGGGLCQWPDVPEYRYSVPAGTKSLFNGDSSFRMFSLGSRLNREREDKEWEQEREQQRREVETPPLPPLRPGPRNPEPEMTREEEVEMILARIGRAPSPREKE
jgi:hypothetical protein